VVRSAVLLDADGIVLKVRKRVQARTFAERALAACRTLLA
jgi:peroxiredoxin